MEQQNIERKLAAILYADVAGYSRLMGEDETGTHQRLSTYLDGITAAIERHGGKIEHFAGDAVLADFSTVLDALTCAVDIQRELKRQNADLPEERRLQFRIGINLGDVIVDRGDIYGDGVNVAARLESLAEPGGICVSEAVRTAIGNKLPLVYEFMGEQSVKNIAEPVSVYRVGFDPSSTYRVTRPKRWRWPRTAIAAIAVVSIGGVAIWNTYLRAPAPPTDVASEPDAALPLPDTPSIAVLPFVNLNDDPEQDYFSDGITNDLITDLSKLSNLFVIASNSVFTYKGTPVKVQEVGRDLGVRYVLEGSIQRAGERVRINAQLIDATTGHHLWAQRYDRELQDIFALQDEVTQKIVTALAVKLTDEERLRLAHRYTHSVDAYDYFLRGQALYAGQTKEDNERAREMFEKAIELDPAFARAYAALAMTRVDDATRQWSPDPAQSVEQALELARKAVAIDEKLPQAHWVLGYVYLWGKKQHDKALEEAQRAIALDPNNADGYTVLATTNNFAGRPAEAIRLIRKAMRLNPPGATRHFSVLGRSYYELGRFDEAITALREALNRNPNFLPSHLLLAASYVRLGQQDDAEWVAAEVLALDPDFSLQHWIERHPAGTQAQSDRLMNDLRTAGFN